MDLWVRSQDKTELLQVFNVYVENCLVRANYGRYYNGCYYAELGKYATEERALEVLDEIQRLITDLQYLSYGIENGEFCSYRPNVYEMPKE